MGPALDRFKRQWEVLQRGAKKLASIWWGKRELRKELLRMGEIVLCWREVCSREEGKSTAQGPDRIAGAVTLSRQEGTWTLEKEQD